MTYYVPSPHILPKDRLRQFIAVPKTGRQFLSTDRLRLLIFRPARTAQISPNDALNRHDLALFCVHGSSGEHRLVRSLRQRHPVNVGCNQMIRHIEHAEPEGGDLVQHLSFVGNCGGQNPIEGTDSVATYEK